MDLLKPKVKFEGRHYRNDELAAWIIGSFKTASDQKVAWETVKFIRENFPDAEVALRGRLVGIDEGET